MKVSSVICVIFTLTVVLALMGILIAAYILKNRWNVADLGFGFLGAYGVILLVFLVVQQIVSLLNNYSWIPKVTSYSKSQPKVGIQVVGYREDPILFRRCMISLSGQQYDNVQRIIIGIDGNEQKDQFMEQSFKYVFPQGLIVRLDKLFLDMDQVQRKNVLSLLQGSKYICVSQPHAGKRQIMYTCLHMHSPQTQYICLSDSDTYFLPDTISQMSKVLDGHDEMRKQKPGLKQCGAVTGNVYIWNRQNFISYMSAIRYWYAFNVQRAADSYWGVVSCISGPLGLYKKKAIDQVKQSWINQYFLGIKCSFGDDRHLTNLLLGNNYCTYYTPKSHCKTDTPAQLLRWIAQQTRWSKSFYREFLLNIPAFPKHFLWLACNLVFQTIFPFFIIATMIWFISQSFGNYCIIFIMLVIMATLRSVMGILRTGNPVYIYYTLYIFLYVLFLIPCKIWGLLTLWNNQWGTSDRFARAGPVLKSIHAIIWAVAYSSYYIAMGIKHLATGDYLIPATGWVFLGFLGFTVLLFVSYHLLACLYLLPKCKQQFEQNIKQTNVLIQSRRAQVVQQGKFINVKTTGYNQNDVSFAAKIPNNFPTQQTIPSQKAFQFNSATNLHPNQYL